MSKPRFKVGDWVRCVCPNLRDVPFGTECLVLANPTQYTRYSKITLIESVHYSMLVGFGDGKCASLDEEFAEPMRCPNALAGEGGSCRVRHRQNGLEYLYKPSDAKHTWWGTLASTGDARGGTSSQPCGFSTIWETCCPVNDPRQAKLQSVAKETPSMTTIDITPVGFRPETPSAVENIARANKAAERRDSVAYALADLLKELVDESGGITRMLKALRRDNAASIDEEGAAELTERYATLVKRRADLDEEILRAMGGQPPLPSFSLNG